MGKELQVRFSGFGGQGLVLAGIILGEAVSLYEERYAVQSQSYGPEARGGASRAEVVISDQEIDYLEVADPDLLLILSQQAYNKFAGRLKEDAVLIIDSDLVKMAAPPVTKVYGLPLTRIAREQAGRQIVANIVALGALAALTGIVSKEALEKAVAARAPKGTEELNLKALGLGYQAGRELLQDKVEHRG